VSYRGRARIPYVHAISGLGLTRGTVGGEAPSSPWYGELLTKIADPLSDALAQRIAYGKTDPYYSSYGSSQQYYPAAGAGGYGYSAFGGISPTMLLIGGAALVAMMMLRK